MCKEKIVFDLTKLGGIVYVGRPNGEAARKHFKVSKVDSDKAYPVDVIFPEKARTLTSSFFLGMFGNSVRAAGSRDEFFERFHFNANAQIIDEIELGIKEALMAC